MTNRSIVSCLLWNSFFQPPDDLIHLSKFASLRAPPAFGPAVDLARDETLRFANFHDARCLNFNGVQCGQRVHHGLTQLPSQFQILANWLRHFETHNETAAA